jgi:hypothetical protein
VDRARREAGAARDARQTIVARVLLLALHRSAYVNSKTPYPLTVEVRAARAACHRPLTAGRGSHAPAEGQPWRGGTMSFGRATRVCAPRRADASVVTPLPLLP